MKTGTGLAGAVTDETKFRTQLDPGMVPAEEVGIPEAAVTGSRKIFSGQTLT